MAKPVIHRTRKPRASATAPDKILVEKLGKRFRAAHEDIWVLRDMSFAVAEGEFVAIVGESGCGKTTLLRLIAGLEHPTTGKIMLAGHEVSQSLRDIGFVFQHPVLLPWRTVLDNVVLPAELARMSRSAAQQRAMQLLSLLDLRPFAGHRPQHLSGGMQQRVALARTLLLQPSVLLMDEPFGALDAITREQLNLEFLRMWQRGGQTVVFITHDITEAVFLADQVFLMQRWPGTIAHTFDVPLRRPRTLEMRYEPAFTELCRDIHHAMGLIRRTV